MTAPGLGCSFVLLALLAGCAHEGAAPTSQPAAPQPAPATAEASRGPAFEDCEIGDGNTVPADFPRGALAPASPAEHGFVCVLSAQLAALGEPSLFPLPATGEVYRVLWIRSGGHPVSVRFDRQGSSGQIRAAQTAGKGVVVPGELLEETNIPASADQLSSLLARTEAVRIWAPSPAPAGVPPDDAASIWVFEAARAGDYRVRVFQRETLAHDAGYSALGRTLVGNSGLHIEGALY